MGKDEDVQDNLFSGNEGGDSDRRQYDDPSDRIWSIYVSEARKYDQVLASGWKSDMDGILIFAGLFSASVTAFILEGYKGLKRDSGDATVTLLSQISQQLAAASNNTQITLPAPDQTPFKPTPSALRVNAFWFLSLAFSLACALTATLVQQWARNYIQAIDRHPTPHKRARIRAYLHEGVETFNMETIVHSIPTLLHISVFLFFAGLIEFLLPVNIVIAYILLSIVAVCGALYAGITLLPTICRNCPYRTPISSACWRILQALRLLRYRDAYSRLPVIHGNMADGPEKLATANLPIRNQRDREALRWTLQSLNGDNELEPFVEAMAAFMRTESIGGGHHMMGELVEASRGDNGVGTNTTMDENLRLGSRITRLLVSSNSAGGLFEPARRKRALTCMQAIFVLTIELPPHTPWTSLFDIDTPSALQVFKGDLVPLLAHYATCISAVVAQKLWQDAMVVIYPNDGGSIPAHQLTNAAHDCLRSLNTLDTGEILLKSIGRQPEAHGSAWIIQQLKEALTESSIRDPKAMTLRSKVDNILNNCRVHALIDFLHYLAAGSSLPNEALAITIATLRAMTPRSAFRSVDPGRKLALVRAVGDALAESSIGKKKLPSSVADILFIRILAGLRFTNLADPVERECHDEAKRAVIAYRAAEPNSKAACAVLTLLEAGLGRPPLHSIPT